MLKILLGLYSIVDFVFLIFLVKQYRQLIKSEEYVAESLVNKFILGALAIGGLLLTFILLISTVYYLIS